jgi:hypothetical protein
MPTDPKTWITPWRPRPPSESETRDPARVLAVLAGGTAAAKRLLANAADARDAIDLARALLPMTRADLKAVGQWLFGEHGRPVDASTLQRVLRLLDGSDRP